jgi:hypothetical protein
MNAFKRLISRPPLQTRISGSIWMFQEEIMNLMRRRSSKNSLKKNSIISRQKELMSMLQLRLISLNANSGYL